jgi:hypothetical protein
MGKKKTPDQRAGGLSEADFWHYPLIEPEHTWGSNTATLLSWRVFQHFAVHEIRNSPTISCCCGTSEIAHKDLYNTMRWGSSGFNKVMGIHQFTHWLYQQASSHHHNYKAHRGCYYRP